MKEILDALEKISVADLETLIKQGKLVYCPEILVTFRNELKKSDIEILRSFFFIHAPNNEVLQKLDFLTTIFFNCLEISKDLHDRLKVITDSIEINSPAIVKQQSLPKIKKSQKPYLQLFINKLKASNYPPAFKLWEEHEEIREKFNWQNLKEGNNLFCKEDILKFLKSALRNKKHNIIEALFCFENVIKTATPSKRVEYISLILQSENPAAIKKLSDSRIEGTSTKEWYEQRRKKTQEETSHLAKSINFCGNNGEIEAFNNCEAQQTNLPKPTEKPKVSYVPQTLKFFQTEKNGKLCIAKLSSNKTNQAELPKRIYNPRQTLSKESQTLLDSFRKSISTSNKRSLPPNTTSGTESSPKKHKSSQ